MPAMTVPRPELIVYTMIMMTMEMMMVVVLTSVLAAWMKKPLASADAAKSQPKLHSVQSVSAPRFFSERPNLLSSYSETPLPDVTCWYVLENALVHVAQARRNAEVPTSHLLCQEQQDHLAT
jgi:hypothetical protein